MKVLPSKRALVAAAGALVLFGVFGAFFHEHAPILPAPSSRCPDADISASFGHSHVLPAGDDGADSCTICFFHRCLSHGAPCAVQAQIVRFDSTPVVSASDVVPDSLPARFNEARGPPDAACVTMGG